MPRPVQTLPLPAFQPIDGLKESTQVGLSLLEARNILLRPAGGFKGPPTYQRLWGIGSAATIYATLTALGLTDASNTVALRVARQGKNFLFFYNMPARQCRGLFYMGDDGTYTSGAYDFTASSGLAWEILATDLDDTARWYGSKMGGKALYLGNGVDDNVVVQLGRSATPGKWRKAASNAAPSAPIIALIAPENSANIAASALLFPGAPLTFTVVDFGAANTLSVSTLLSDGTYLTTAESTGTLPGGINAFQGYWAYDCVYNRSTNSTVFKLSSTDPALSSATPVDITDAGTGTHVFFGAGSWVGATQSLTLTVNADWLAGSAGNNVFKAKIEATFNDTLSSTLTGTGTTADPYYYLLSTPAAGSSIDALVSFINADSKVITFITASKSGNDALLLASSGTVLLANGSGTGVSTGYTNRTVTFYQRFWDPGTDGYGYEGVSSPISNELVIAADANNDIRVWCPVNAAAEDGRFGYIRLYMQFEEAPDAVWLLINPDSPVPNGLTGAFTRYASTNEITLAGSGWAANDIVQVATTGTLPTGLTALTNYYLGTGTAAGRWYLSLTPDGTAVTISDAGSGTHMATLQSKCVQIGTQTPFLPADEGGLMFDNQNRPLPHTLHAFTNDQVWRGGVTAYPERLYVSKPSTADEVAPEGVSLNELAFVNAINQSQAGGTNKLTALVASQNRLDCHYPGGVSMRDPANPDEVNFTVTGAGAINQTAVAVWEQKGVFILGGDLQLRMQSVEQTGAGFAAAVASSEFAALAGARYLRDRVDLAELARKPQRVFVFPNVADQHLYMSLPALDGTLKMFAYDFLNGGLVGEFDYPKIYAAAQMEPDRPEIIFSDESGNLMVWDTSAQADRGDVLATSNAWTANSTGSAPPDQYAGWGYVDVGSARYYQAITSVLKTGFFDLGSPAQRKALVGILFRCVKNSRARVSVTLRTLDQAETTITAEPAQTYARVEHRLNRMLGRSTSLQLEFRIVGAEQAPWIIRDVCGLWLAQGRV